MSSRTVAYRDTNFVLCSFKERKTKLCLDIDTYKANDKELHHMLFRNLYLVCDSFNGSNSGQQSHIGNSSHNNMAYVPEGIRARVHFAVRMTAIQLLEMSNNRFPLRIQGNYPASGN